MQAGASGIGTAPSGRTERRSAADLLTDRYNDCVRLFYATFLSDENMRAYQALVDELIEEVPDALRSIPPTTHHLTLAFLGEIADTDVEVCINSLAGVERQPAFAFTLARPRLLMGRGRPRLICADVADGKEQVSEAQAALTSQLSVHLPALELRPKPPHVTLARFHKRARRSQARRVEESLSRHYDDSAPWQDRFTSVALVRSSLTPSGPVYESLATANLSSV